MSVKARPVWHRPDGPINIWRIVDGTEKLDDGSTRPIKFSIQEVPEDRREEALQFMVDYFLVDEPICKSLKVTDDPVILQDLFIVWNYCLDQGIVEAAYIIDENNQIVELAAINMLNVITDETDKEMHDLISHLKSPKSLRLFDIMNEVSKRADARKILKVDKYIGALGLTVSSQMRGQKLGQRMLEARTEIGKKYNIPATSTIFTAKVSQILAERSGFKEVTSADYADFLYDDGQQFFPNIESKCMKIMMKRIE